MAEPQTITDPGTRPGAAVTDAVPDTCPLPD